MAWEQIDGQWFNFEPTTDPEEAKTYNGFISPDGKFYKVNKKKSHYTSHDLWAQYFIKHDKLKTGFFKSEYVKILRKRYGFLLYTHSTRTEHKSMPIICLPLKSIGSNTNMTNEQAKMLYDIMKLNNELEYYPKEDHSSTDDMRDVVFRDLAYGRPERGKKENK